MSEQDWFGWRVVSKSGIGHAFKGITKRSWDDYPKNSERSLCGKVTFGFAVRVPESKYRPCKTCAAIWSARYPKES